MNELLLHDENAEFRILSANRFCKKFLDSKTNCSRYVMGRNVYTDSILSQIHVDGVIDDFTKDSSYRGCPIVKMTDVGSDALVINAVGGRVLTAETALASRNIQHLDYFYFRKYSGLTLAPVVFNETFEEEFEKNQDKYQWVYGLLSDDESRVVYRKLVSFRFDNDIQHLVGFASRESEQYFEEFLGLRQSNETFIDIGGFDGYTSKKFISLCPEYNRVVVYEPDSDNYDKCVENLREFSNVTVINKGLSDTNGTLKFFQQGSGSVISSEGDVSIEVVRLDDSLTADVTPTFMKMDIEGAELSAIKGAENTIRNNHPRLAICIYHAPEDFWRIPEAILKIRKDYSVYLRHYTESIYETVMFFVPK